MFLKNQQTPITNTGKNKLKAVSPSRRTGGTVFIGEDSRQLLPQSTWPVFLRADKAMKRSAPAIGPAYITHTHTHRSLGLFLYVLPVIFLFS